MQSGIPILINKKGNQEAFKIFPIQQRKSSIHRRQRTCDANQMIQQKKTHDTLDPNLIRNNVRYRRASSSGAANKFPKDFFKENQLTSPIKIRFSRQKKQRVSDCPISYKQSEHKNNEEKYVQSEKSKPLVANPSEQLVETPKFNKRVADDALQQHKSKSTNTKSVRLKDYLAYKQEQIGDAIDIFNKKVVNQNIFKNSFGIHEASLQQKNAILLQTLGNAQNNIFKNLQIGNNKIVKKGLKKKKSQKQNISEEIENIEKKKQKNIKAFLSTKGLNWKLINKGSNKKISKKDGMTQKVLNQIQIDKMITFRKVETKPQQIEQPSKFRVRKHY